MESETYKLRESINILRNELLKHSDVYEAFIASIESAVKEKSEPLQDCDIFIDCDEWSRHILNRIIGEE